MNAKLLTGKIFKVGSYLSPSLRSKSLDKSLENFGMLQSKSIMKLNLDNSQTSPKSISRNNTERNN